MTKIIKDFPLYSVNLEGEIINTKTGCKLKPWVGKNGYLTVSLTNNGYAKKVYIHRLLGEAFISNPEEKPTINHKDGNKRNNKLENLEWASHSENIKHAYSSGLQPYRRKYSKEEYTNLLFTRFFMGESITSISASINQGLTQLSLHLRESAIREEVLDQYERILNSQKNSRAKKAGEKQRKSIHLQMIDMNTKEIKMVFTSLVEATTFLNKKSGGPISNVLAGRTKTAYGYLWVKV